jgi:hypothetical protein
VLLAVALAAVLQQASHVFVGRGAQPAPLGSSGTEPLVAMRGSPRLATWTIDPEPTKRVFKGTQFDEDDLDEEELETARMPLPDRGIDLDGDKLDNLEEWYQEQLTGEGGSPDGFIRDLILKSFYAPFNSNVNVPKEGGWVPKFVMYTGEHGLPCDTDYETAFENMKANIKENKNYMLKDDGTGWTWIVAGQNPGGLFLYTQKSPPFGERPLALIKQSDPDEFFEKIDWHRLFIRLHKWQLWGNKAKGFPYPVRGLPVLS